jgi:hypothetical protein
MNALGVLRRLAEPPSLPSWIHFVVFRWLGLLLLVAAGLKLHGLAVEPVAHVGPFSAPEFQVALIAVEVLLGLWLLWGRHPIGAWLTTLAAFTVFAGASFYLAWIGQSSCGCFGRLSVSPWYSFAIDLAALAALLVGRPDLQPLHQQPRQTLSGAVLLIGKGLAGPTAVLGLLAGLALYHFGSLSSALAYLRGEQLWIEPRLVDMGEGYPGETQAAAVEVVNQTDHPIRLIGGTADCSCTTTEDLPLTIPAGDSRPITVKIHLPRAPGMYTRTARLLTDDEQTRIIGFRLTGRIRRAVDDMRTSAAP